MPDRDCVKFSTIERNLSEIQMADAGWVSDGCRMLIYSQKGSALRNFDAIFNAGWVPDVPMGAGAYAGPCRTVFERNLSEIRAILC